MRVDQPNPGQFTHLEDAFEQGDSTADGSVIGSPSAIIPPGDPGITDGPTHRASRPVTEANLPEGSSFQALLDRTLGATGPSADRALGIPSGRDVEISGGIAEEGPQSEPIEEMPIGGRQGNDLIQAVDVEQVETTVSKVKGPHSDPIEELPIGRL